MARRQQRKMEQLRKRYAPGQNWFISEDSAQRRRIGGRQMTNKTSSEEKREENTDLENKQDHLQNLSWPVSPNGDGLLINVKPLYPCAEPEEVLGAFTPSTADSTKDPTPENNVEEQEINDPEEPSPQPQAFSDPQEDTQIFTDSSKLLTKEEDEAEVGASSQADDIKESVLQTPQKGSMVQCCVQRDRTDKSGPTYRMFQELEDGKKQLLLVARRMKKNNTSSYVITDGESDEDHNVVGRLSFNRQHTQFTLSDSGRNPTKSSGALQEESSTQELLALSYESLFGFMKSQQMTAVIPSPDRNSQRVSFVEGSLLKQLKRKNQGPNLIKLNTKEPVWSSKQKAHVLDFNGRVKKASLKNFQLACPANQPERKKKQKAYVLDLNGRVKKGAVKNFQLACPANPDEKVIQFGRVDEDHFLQDCSFHLCTLQAFAITSTTVVVLSALSVLLVVLPGSSATFLRQEEEM
ncbi:hypothetical protein SRHO_G00312540 [Serrasalmus rhombeus]